MEIVIALIDDEFPINVIGNIGEQLAEPLEEQQDRRVLPRNQNYYEETITNYMGDLFVAHFRMTRLCFEELLRIIGNNPTYRASRGIPLEKELLFCIWILAKPECFLAAGDRFGLARSSAYIVFKKIVAVLVSLLPQIIVWPADFQPITDVFHARSRGFPGIVGAIDGCHIPIKQPEENPVDYYNRKEYHSIILQGICDHRMLFLDIFVGMPGRMHDARVFRLSPISTRLQNNHLLLPDQHILGDSAYPILTTLLTPYRDNGHLNDLQINFNNRLSAIRSIIERAFALLLGKFRRLKYLDISGPDVGTKMICAAIVLHNFIILNNGGDANNENEGFEEVPMIPQEDYQGQYDLGQPGAAKRDAIANLLFIHHQ